MQIGLMPDDSSSRFVEYKNQIQAAEQNGFASFWLADHLIFRFPEQPENGCWEALTMLTGLAAVTSTIAIGPLVVCTSFRNPALLAKMADTLDEVSNGRFILGLGAGWHEPEYTTYGYPYDHLAGRFEESLKVIVPMLRKERVTLEGQYVTARDAVLIPQGPTPTGPKIWIGAKRPRMLRLVAQYADAWNTVWHVDPAGVAGRYADMKAACVEVGRDPDSLELTAGTFVHVLKPGETADPNEKAIVGSAEEVAEKLRGFADIGVKHLVVILSSTDVEHIERFAKAREILAQA